MLMFHFLFDFCTFLQLNLFFDDFSLFISSFFLSLGFGFGLLLGSLFVFEILLSLLCLKLLLVSLGLLLESQKTGFHGRDFLLLSLNEIIMFFILLLLKKLLTTSISLKTLRLKFLIHLSQSSLNTFQLLLGHIEWLFHLHQSLLLGVHDLPWPIGAVFLVWGVNWLAGFELWWKILAFSLRLCDPALIIDLILFIRAIFVFFGNKLVSLLLLSL